ncbi:MAG: AraC family transcriptional regulator [Pseudomonadota bacterium]
MRRNSPAAADLGWLQVMLLPAAPYSVRHTLSRQTIGIAIERQRGLHAFGGDGRRDFEAWPGEISVIQPGVETFSESAHGGEYLVLRTEQPLSSGQPRAVLGADPRVCRGALRLRRLLRQRGDAGLIENEAALLLSHLARRCAPDNAWRPHRPAAMRGLLDAIDDGIDAAWRLQDMASLVQQSPQRFFREFVCATGFTPHAYLMERRLQRARRMLASGQAAIAEVAAACGFAHQSHLGAQMRRALACSPAELRRAAALR